MMENLYEHAGRASQTCWRSFMNMLAELHKHAGRAS